jgi:ABC-type Fe3+/spermidine/putrescine transport system ATPase subunit
VDEFDVTLRGVVKSFGGRRAVDDVTLDIRRGEFFSLLGPSGCGKTTLMRIIAGFDAADSGAVTLGGADMAGVPPHKRDVNMVFQNYALFPHLSVGENVAFGLRIAKRDDVDGRVKRALEKVSLAGYEPRSVTTLSGGEQQRVALARAFVCEPPLLFADEPTGSLDAVTGESVIRLMFELNQERKSTLVLVTHDPSIAGLCGETITIAAGRLV